MDVCRAIGSIHDVQKLMITIMEQVTQAFGADRSSVYLHDPQRHELWTLVAQGLDQHRALRLPDNQGLSGHVFQANKSMLVADTLSSPFFGRDYAERIGYRPRSMLLVPLHARNQRCTGVLQVMDRRIDYFNGEDLALLEAIGVQVSICVENAALHEAQERQFRSFVGALSAALDARDPLTAIHSINVSNYAMGIGTRLGLDTRSLERLRIAGLIHDIGKIGVREALLTKPGSLTPEEYAEMKRHADQTHRILSKIEFTKDLAGVEAVASAHHERLDGSGYPQGLAGDAIPLPARILAVADVFDALTQKRHYRNGMSMAKAFATIDNMVPHALDRRCVDALRAFLGCGKGAA